MTMHNLCVSPGIKRIARAFSAKAHGYDAHAGIQTDILERLLQYPFLDSDGNNGRWLDLGCGTGIFEHKIARQNGNAAIIGIDLAWQALLIARRRHPRLSVVQADAQRAPFKKNSFSAGIMVSALQWFSDPVKTLAQTVALLKPGAFFLYAVFLEGSYGELCTLRSRRRLPQPVRFVTAVEWGAMVSGAGLTLVRAERYSAVKYFSSARELLRQISASGASAVAGPRLSRQALASLCRDYEQEFLTDGGVPVTYNVALGMARKGASF